MGLIGVPSSLAKLLSYTSVFLFYFGCVCVICLSELLGGFGFGLSRLFRNRFLLPISKQYGCLVFLLPSSKNSRLFKGTIKLYMRRNRFKWMLQIRFVLMLEKQGAIKCDP